jgi:hypothetical protein
MKGKIKKIKQSKEQWVWAFYEIDIKHTDTILRGIATNSELPQAKALWLPTSSNLTY